MRNLHLTFDWHYLHTIKVRWRFRKIMWLSQNIWTLIKFKFPESGFGLIELVKFQFILCNRWSIFKYLKNRSPLSASIFVGTHFCDPVYFFCVSFWRYWMSKLKFDNQLCNSAYLFWCIQVFRVFYIGRVTIKRFWKFNQNLERSLVVWY